MLKIQRAAGKVALIDYLLEEFVGISFISGEVSRSSRYIFDKDASHSAFIWPQVKFTSLPRNESINNSIVPFTRCVSNLNLGQTSFECQLIRHFQPKKA